MSLEEVLLQVIGQSATALILYWTLRREIREHQSDVEYYRSRSRHWARFAILALMDEKEELKKHIRPTKEIEIIRNNNR